MGNLVVGGPFAVEVRLDLDLVAGAFTQAFGEEQYAGIMLMCAGAVARLAGNQDNEFLVGGE